MGWSGAIGTPSREGGAQGRDKMMFLLAIFCSPLALLITGKPFQALFNLILYVLSIAAWATIILHSLGFALWAVALIHAILAINAAQEDRRARRIADAMERR